MIKYVRNSSLILLVIGLAGCASPPRLVDADIPLVEPSSYVSNELVPSRFWSTLDNSLETQFAYKDYLVQVGPPYDSALGTRCRLLTFSLDNAPVGTRVACGKQSTQAHKSIWFLTKDILNETTLVSLK